MKRLCLTLLLSIALCLPQLLISPAAHATYVVEYGDALTITVPNAAQYSMAGDIRPDGEVTIPTIGDISVAGLTTDEIREKVTRLVGAYVHNPQVTVVVSGFRSVAVTMLGQVASPGILKLPQGSQTLYDAIASAGGFTDRAVRDKVMVIRGNGPDAQRYVVNVDQMMKSGDFSKNMLLQAGDKVQVPEVWYPDIAKITSNIAVVTSLLATVAILIGYYQRASGP
ncbi:MAG TPA: polysaccharide biosynthesis/export family protein [Oscillatoriaceae cyanobacterium]